VSSRAKHLFRIASLLVPSAMAWTLAFYTPHDAALGDVVGDVLAPMWLVLASALMLRIVAVVGDPHRAGAPVLERVDVLTSAGTALAWLSAGAIACAVWLGWASLAVLGMLGSAVFHVAALVAHVALRSGDPIAGARFERRFSPAVVTEGDDVVEELRVTGARIPTGYRMFVSGRVGPRWATSRHVLEATESGAEIVLESEVGPAVRGDHEAEPLDLWIEDCFGICRSARAHLGAARLRVLPRAVRLAKAPKLADAGLGPRAPKQASRLPTEGSLALREYQQGDDVRRIHWVRSLASRELIVRLPDEIPPDRPRVRLVLDTFFPVAAALECDGPAEVLDALVRVWLAVGSKLADRGVEVTLVAALPRPDRPGETDVVRHRLLARAPSGGRELGARVTWQDRVPVSSLLTDETTFVVSRGVLVKPPACDEVKWIVVLPQISEPPLPLVAGARLPYATGSPENRWSCRRRVAEARGRAWADRAQLVIALRTHVAWPPPGSYAALVDEGGGVHLQAVPAR
jgi:uncharacterized protein (DUF58 family)